MKRTVPGLHRAVCLAIAGAVFAAGAAHSDDGFREAVQADWAEQEAHRDRKPTDLEAIRDALHRAQRLFEDVAAMADAPNLNDEAAALERLVPRVADAANLGAKARQNLYHDVRWLARRVALENPVFPDGPLVFLERRRFICQMLHEYLGYYYDYADIAGGGVYRLERPGYSMEVENLVEGRFPRGNYTTLAVSFDGESVYFAFSPRAPKKPDFYSADVKYFNLYAVDSDGGDLRRLTEGRYDDFDPCPLPDGGIAFMSTRRGGFIRCNNPWEPLPTYTLHRMEADGSDLKTLSFHETCEWHPSVLADGTIAYSRWDYVDRSAAHFHGLWTSNPDGTNPRHLFGSYTQRINACFQPHSVPGSNKVAFIAGAHHADVGGSLVLLDPDLVARDGETGEDRFDAIEVLTPDVCFPEAPGWPDTYFHSPWPLSEDYFLVSYSHDPLPGMSGKSKEDSETGLYLFDRFGNLELLYRKDGISSMYPVPLAPRPVPRIAAGPVDTALVREGEFVLSNVGRGLGVEQGPGRVHALRVFQFLPKSETHVANDPRLGYANAESARMLLGTVPVEPDGSAYFRAPAQKLLAFQAVDETGRAVQGMRSATYLQPGERRSCVGCHEPAGSAPDVQPLAALLRGPSAIEPGPDGSKPWSYARLVQPVLDARCVRCHDGAEDSDKPDLRDEPEETFSVSYKSLEPYVRWYEWGDKTIRPIATMPGHMPSVESPLVAILENDDHAKAVQLSGADRRRIYLWLDGNAAFYGAFSEPERLAQRSGKAIPIPELH